MADHYSSEPLGENFTSVIHADTYPAIDSTKADLTSKYVFITGAAQGIGRQIALSFAAAGAKGIALADQSSFGDLEVAIQRVAKDAGKPPPQVLKIKVDISSEQGVADAAKETEQVFGKLDILINNAGYMNDFSVLGEGDADGWWRTWEINVRGIYTVTRALLPLLLSGGDKTVVNLSSIAAQVIEPTGSAYHATKFAVLRLTEYYCADYAKEGLLVYCIHPGGVMTELASKMPDIVQHRLTDTPQLAADTLVSLTLERREWLAGRYISVKWDMPEFYGKEDEVVKENKLVMRMRF